MEVRFDSRVNCGNHLLDYRSLIIDLANCNHGFVHRKLILHRNFVDVVLHKHISNMMSNILRYPDIYQTHIHIQVRKLVLLEIIINKFLIGLNSKEKII